MILPHRGGVPHGVGRGGVGLVSWCGAVYGQGIDPRAAGVEHVTGPTKKHQLPLHVDTHTHPAPSLPPPPHCRREGWQEGPGVSVDGSGEPLRDGSLVVFEGPFEGKPSKRVPATLMFHEGERALAFVNLQLPSA